MAPRHGGRPSATKNGPEVERVSDLLHPEVGLAQKNRELPM